MLLKLIGLAGGLVVVGIALGFTGSVPLEAIGAFYFLVGGAVLGLLALVAGILLVEAGLFGHGDRWRRFN